MKSDLVLNTPQGLYCPPGNFYIDPWRQVQNALITHAHSDHLRSGNGHYWCSPETLALLKHRVGESAIATPDVLQQHEADNKLLLQVQQEVLSRFSPLTYPLVVERLGA